MIFEAIKISLKVTLIATLITFIIAVLIAWRLNDKTGKLKNIIETILCLPLFLPPSVIGYLLLILFGVNGFIGKYLYEIFNIKIIFTQTAAIIACICVSTPLMYQCVKAAFESVDKQYREAAMVMGASNFQVFYMITIPLTINHILAGLILAFGRAFGEFGATLMVAGNIPGKTQTIPMAMYYAVENGDTNKSNILLVIVLVISTTMIGIYNYILKKQKNN